MQTTQSGPVCNRELSISLGKVSIKGPLVPIQDTGRQMLIPFQEKGGIEFKKLVKEGHIVNFNKCTSDHFESQVVKAAKKDGLINIAMNDQI